MHGGDDPCAASVAHALISKPARRRSRDCATSVHEGWEAVGFRGEGWRYQGVLVAALFIAVSAWCPTVQGFLVMASCCHFTPAFCRSHPRTITDQIATPHCPPWNDHCSAGTTPLGGTPGVSSSHGRHGSQGGAGLQLTYDENVVMSALSGSPTQRGSSSTSLFLLPPSSSQATGARRFFWKFQGLRQDDNFGNDGAVCPMTSSVARDRGRSRELSGSGRWSLEAQKLDSSRHGGGEEHGRKVEGGDDPPGSRSSSTIGDDIDVSLGRNSPLRWMRRTLRAGWGSRRRRANARASAGRWGLHVGVSGRGRVSAGGAGQQNREVSVVGVEETETGKRGDRENGWGFFGKKGMSGEAVRHAWVSKGGSVGGGGGGDQDDVGKQAWGSRSPWTDWNALQELFRTKGGDLHIRTVAKIQTMLGREDQAEETLLRLIRDPYHLGDASWTPESAEETAEWRRLDAHQKRIKDKHLKDVIQDTERSLALSAEYEGTILDYSRMNVSQLTMKLLFDLAKRQDLKEKIQAMFSGEKINNTENRPVLHVALRMDKTDDAISVDGVNVVEQVHDTLDMVKEFSEQVRSGTLRGATGKLLTNIVAVGIGGSYLGPEFVHEAFKTQEYKGREQAELYRLRFLSNVDPVDVRRTLYDLDPEETLVVVISKTFTTAETMLNARTARQWLWDTMGKDLRVTEKHMAACASESSAERVKAFGIPRDRLFPLWDWVGGRYSVCSSVGALPLSLKYGFRQFENFLAGARSMDKHFLHAPFEKNLPVLMGVLGVWNISFMGYKTRTILPYAEALLKFPAHIQQLAMESNGKRVTRNGKKVSYDIGQVDFGEPGTNGQHSFFQLLHMGQICPAEFIGFIESQHHLHVEGEPICSHDELMANFFAQPDALAVGKSREDLAREGCRPELVPHRTFDGNRPSLSLLMPKVNAYHLGQILALYEHRTAVEGFMWDINSFDQWGVELGKSLATNVRGKMEKFRSEGQEAPTGLNPSTQRLMSRYLQQSETLVKKVGNINHRSRNRKPNGKS